ncbi:MAG: Gfo/Idh/MocA family oxidoreductase [Verrucomicrobia bacterium]|nr:Gfo/Idh/MocA family oxidoreductase [Verrucomicrobiota bacterium]
MKQETSGSPTSSRRKFLKYGAGFGAALAWPNSTVIGANSEVRVGIIGVNGRGRHHLNAYLNMPKARVAAICDVAPDLLDARTTLLSAQQKSEVKGFEDMRDMFEKGDIDAVSVATPNHWHSLAGIWAMQAGKDAYVEKPISHNVWEGRQLVKVARKHNKICQGGTQSRSMPTIRAAVDYVHSGKLGKIQFVKGMCYKARPPIGLGGGGEIPPGLDYDLWCGPREIEKPLRRKRLHYDWHWFYAYGNGDMGNQGIHQMDVARWFLGEKKLSPRVMSIGGRLGYKDDAETPNTQLVYHDYDSAPLIFETRGLPRDKASQETAWGKNMNRPEEFPELGGVGVVVQCENGRVYCSSGGKVKVTDNKGVEMTQIKPPNDNDQALEPDHFKNFINAVHSRKVSELHADCEETHISSALCHTGMISHFMGENAHDEAVREKIKSDDFLAGRYAAMAEHLMANDVNLTKESITLGPWLTFNPDTELFEKNGDAIDQKANQLTKESYRAPFVVPEKI